MSFHEESGSSAINPSASDRQRRKATRRSCTGSASNPAATPSRLSILSGAGTSRSEVVCGVERSALTDAEGNLHLTRLARARQRESPLCLGDRGRALLHLGSPDRIDFGGEDKTQPGQPRSYNDAGFKPLTILLRGLKKLRYMHRNPAQHGFPSEPERWPRSRLDSRLLATAVTDHLQTGDSQVSVLRLAACILHLSFFFLFCLRLVGCGTSDGHFVADVLIQLDAGAAQSPSLTVFALDGKLAGFVTLLQTTGHSLRLLRFFILSSQSDRAQAQANNGDQPKSQLCDLVRHVLPPDFPSRQGGGDKTLR